VGIWKFFAHGVNAPNNAKECKVKKVAYFSKGEGHRKFYEPALSSTTITPTSEIHV
jgi:hypothetical protein